MSTVTVNRPRTRKQRDDRPVDRPRPRRQPRYHVVLWDDDDHTYDYVIRMLRELFAHSFQRSYEMACQVDQFGRVICLTTNKEHAELKRDQIQAFGRDEAIIHCKGSMSATIEPAADGE